MESRGAVVWVCREGEQCREVYARAGGVLLPAELAARLVWVELTVSSQVLISHLSLRVLMVLQVPRVWLVRGASLVFLGSVVREDSPAYLAHR